MDDLTLGEQARWLQRCIGLGLLEPADAVAWADRHIEENESPDPDVIEVALGGSLPTRELLARLGEVQGNVDEIRVRRSVFRTMAELVSSSAENADKVGRALLRLAGADEAAGGTALNELFRRDENAEAAEPVTAVAIRFLSWCASEPSEGPDADEIRRGLGGWRVEIGRKDVAFFDQPEPDFDDAAMSARLARSVTAVAEAHLTYVHVFFGADGEFVIYTDVDDKFYRIGSSFAEAMDRLLFDADYGRWELIRIDA